MGEEVRGRVGDGKREIKGRVREREVRRHEERP